MVFCPFVLLFWPKTVFLNLNRGIIKNKIIAKEGIKMPTFYCYSRCSTCKKAEKWLNEHQVDFKKIDLVATPPAASDLKRWITANQDKGLRYFFNTSGQHYRQQGLKDKLADMTIDQAAELLAGDGKLIKRPLMVEGDHVTAGFKEPVYEVEWL